MSSINSLLDFAARLRQLLVLPLEGGGQKPPGTGDFKFNQLALELYRLQLEHNAAYRRFCQRRGAGIEAVSQWTDVPAIPTSAFKELELSSLSNDERTEVFFSSGTTEQKPSRHYHSGESLKLYEASLWPWFERHVLAEGLNGASALPCPLSEIKADDCELMILTPPRANAAHSSLVHMFETVRRKLGALESTYIGKVAEDDSWTIDFRTAIERMQTAAETGRPLVVLGTAFSFVHLLDFLTERKLRFELPAGSRALETGGYKGKSRSMPKGDLHRLITKKLGIPDSQIVCEYGMSELSSQAYDRPMAGPERIFHFPPWARVQIVSPETGREVGDGEMGLIRVFDLANVYSVMGVQTEDLGIRRGAGFELIGRTMLAEARGCSLMAG